MVRELTRALRAEKPTKEVEERGTGQVEVRLPGDKMVRGSPTFDHAHKMRGSTRLYLPPAPMLQNPCVESSATSFPPWM